MTYTYAYKTSDGARHEGSMDASSREEVFTVLRARGIRPIKVVAADGSKANGEKEEVRRKKEEVWRGIRLVLLVPPVLLVLAAGAWWAVRGGAVAYLAGTGGAPADAGRAHFSQYSAGEKSAYIKLDAAVEGVAKSLADDPTEAELNRRLSEGFEVSAESISPLYALIDSRASAIACARKGIRRKFADAVAGFTPDGRAMRDVQRLYGVRMSQLDALEIANANRRLALDILDKNRGKWKPGKNGPEFSDSRLARMYNYCLEGLATDAATSRWQKDFGMGGATD